MSGLTYDMVVLPPFYGTETDQFGNQKPVAILKFSVNSQYMVEGFTAGFMMVMGSCGIILLDLVTTRNLNM